MGLEQIQGEINYKDGTKYIQTLIKLCAYLNVETAKGQVPKLEMMEALRTVMGVAPLERLSQDTFELVERQVQEIRVLLVQQDFIQTLQSHHVFLHVEMAKEAGSEACDDGGVTNDDGCSST